MKKGLSSHGIGHRNDAERAADIAVDILTFLADDPERLERFLALTGLGLGDLRSLAGTPDFNVSLLDYLTADEATLLAFAERFEHDPQALECLRLRLSPPEPFD